MTGHTRHGVQFDHPGPPVLVCQYVHPPPATGTHGIECLQRQSLQLGLGLRIQTAGDQIACVVGDILGVVVVERVRGLELDQRQHLTAEDRCGIFRACNPALGHDMALILRGSDPCGMQLLGIVGA